VASQGRFLLSLVKISGNISFIHTRGSTIALALLCGGVRYLPGSLSQLLNVLGWVNFTVQRVCHSFFRENIAQTQKQVMIRFVAISIRLVKEEQHPFKVLLSH
jgi:hypothetical protein